MPGNANRRVLEDLRARIETIEKRPPLARSGFDAEAGGKLLPLPRGVLHEVFADNQRNSGAAFGFALLAAKGLVAEGRPAILVMQLSRDTQDIGVPYGVGLKSFGLDPEAIVLCLPETMVELLWAIEEAIACRAVAAVVADVGNEVKALDFTVTRRLSLRSAAGDSSVFLVRSGQEREATAARMRWRIEPTSSGSLAFDARAPGNARWHVELEKGQLGPGKGSTEWVLDWTENGYALADIRTGRAILNAGAAVPRSASALLGYRLPEAV
jgi:protein ImuA